MPLLKNAMASVFIGLAVLSMATFADDPLAPPKAQDKLVGTWKYVSKKSSDGTEVKAPQGITIIKVISPTHWMVATYDSKGEVSRAFGGTYTLKGETFEEIPEFGASGSYDLERLKGKAQSFRCQIDNNTWHHTGILSNGGRIDELWERFEKK